MPKQQNNKKWLVDVQPAGRGGKRFRKTFDTKAEGLAYEAWLKTKINETPEWQPAKRDLRKLSSLVDLWYEHHGTGLRAGKNTYSRLRHLCAALGDPFADKFTVNMFASYRRKRMDEGISQNNLNREHAYLRSVFNELARLGYWKGENPLAKIRQFKIQEKELTFLTLDQIDRLLKEMETGRNPDVHIITRICLTTGARWSEAEEMSATQLQNGMIQFSMTKSGKNRAVPIDRELNAELQEIAKKVIREDYSSTHHLLSEMQLDELELNCQLVS
ncbi:phage integrase [Undibacterium sp. SXout20W]|uniref:phage integrase n=1 Tax=Undibacterium sp. SXout20W TaxID=3413051 RepID=UPI003BEFE381